MYISLALPHIISRRAHSSYVAPCRLKSAGLVLYAASPLLPWPEIPLGVMERLSNESTKSERRDALGHNSLLCHTDILYMHSRY